MLDLTSLNQGIYILNIKTDTGSASFKIVKN
ncbi:T9SS type A sorting domain-containing protein [Aquimarina sp. U1-2]